MQAAADLAEQQFRAEEEAYIHAEQIAARNRAEAAAAKEVSHCVCLGLLRPLVLDCSTSVSQVRSVTVILLFGLD